MTYMTYLIMNSGEEEGLDSDIIQEIPFLEGKLPGQNELKWAKILADNSSPRLFMTHMQFRFLEKQVLEDKLKVIVVMRNPKDTLVSFYHFYRMSKFEGNFPGTWGDFFQLYKRNVQCLVICLTIVLDGGM
jgi:hypothetical protein